MTGDVENGKTAPCICTSFPYSVMVPQRQVIVLTISAYSVTWGITLVTDYIVYSLCHTLNSIMYALIKLCTLIRFFKSIPTSIIYDQSQTLQFYVLILADYLIFRRTSHQYLNINVILNLSSMIYITI